MEEKLFQYLEKGAVFAQEFAAKHGDQAWEIVKTVYKINAIQRFLMVFMFIVAAGIFAKISQKCFKIYNEKVAKNHYYTGMEVPGAFFACASIACICLSIGFISEVWEWIGLFYPEAVIAKDVYYKVVK